MAGKTDANIAVMNGDAALIVANGRIASGNGCIESVRKKYEGRKATD